MTPGWWWGGLGLFLPFFQGSSSLIPYLASFPDPTGLSWGSPFCSFNLILGSYGLGTSLGGIVSNHGGFSPSLPRPPPPQGSG